MVIISLYRRAALAALCCLMAFALAACDTSDVNDLDAPLVLSTYPLNGDTSISTAGITVMAAFNEAIDPYSVNYATFTLSKPGTTNVLVPGYAFGSGAAAYFVPIVELEPNTTYVATLTTGVTDMAGNGLLWTYSWMFTTGASFSASPNFMNAYAVLGQGDFYSGLPNRGGTVSALSMNSPSGTPLIYQGVAFLPDTGNNRVLAYSTLPFISNSPADSVLGQLVLNTSTAATGSMGMSGPRSVSFSGTDLWSAVADTDNNRVLLWYGGLPNSFTASILVLGQPDFYTTTPGCTWGGLYRPTSALVINGKLVVTDSGNNRILIWSAIPSSSGYPPDLVLGQPDFYTCTDYGAAPWSVTYPTGLWSDGASLLVADTGNNRVLVWKPFPFTTAQSANTAIGQPDLYSNAGGASSVNLFAPTSMSMSGTWLYVTDTGNNRVMAWYGVPYGYEPASFVIGQSDFLHTAANDDNQDGVPDANPTQRTLNAPDGVATYGYYTIISDTGNNRALVFLK